LEPFLPISENLSLTYDKLPHFLLFPPDSSSFRGELSTSSYGGNSPLLRTSQGSRESISFSFPRLVLQQIIYFLAGSTLPRNPPPPLLKLNLGRRVFAFGFFLVATRLFCSRRCKYYFHKLGFPIRHSKPSSFSPCPFVHVPPWKFPS